MTSLALRTFAETHVNARAGSAWRFAADGTLTKDTSGGTLRLDHDPVTLEPRGMLCEGPADNGIENPAFIGGTPGTPGTFPLGCSRTGVTGLSDQVVGFGVEDGIPYWDHRVFGTPGASSPIILYLRPTTGLPGLSGELWALSAAVTLVGGDLTNIAWVRLRVAEHNAGGTLLNSSGEDLTVISRPLRAAQMTAYRTFNQGTTANASGHLALQVTSGQPIDITLRIGLPALRKSAIPYTCTYPLDGTTGVSSRAGDKITRPLGHTFLRTAFTHVVRGLFAQSAPAGMARGIWQMDDGTNANRIRLENTAGGNALVLVVTVGGVDVASVPLGNMTPGTPFAVALAMAEGDLSAVMGGGAVLTATPSIPPGLGLERVGASGFDHANPMNGWIRRRRLFRERVDNGSLLALVA